MSRFFAASLRTLMSLCAVALAGAAHAEIEVEGFKFADTATVQGQVLQLNGAGVSSVLSTKSTAVAFYLPKKQTTMEGAVAEKGVKRIHFFMVRDVSARDLSNAMLDRIRQNVPTAEFSANIVATSQLGTVFGNRKRVFKGDEIIVDYTPSTQSTQFTLNGQRVGETIMGESFFPMLMKVWIGPKVRGSTRDALLGVAQQD